MTANSPGPFIFMSRGRRIDLSGPQYYQDILTTIAQEILQELTELEKINLENLQGELLAACSYGMQAGRRKNLQLILMLKVLRKNMKRARGLIFQLIIIMILTEKE